MSRLESVTATLVFLSLGTWSAPAAIIAGTSTTTPLTYATNNHFVQIVNTNTNTWMGVEFTVPAGSNYFLNSIVMPLWAFNSDSTAVTFRLYGIPGNVPTSVLETATVNGIPTAFNVSYALMTGTFSGNTLLQAGARYTIVGYLPADSTFRTVYWAASNPAASVRQWYGTANSGGGWNTILTNPGPAFQINATAQIPEPATGLLAAGALTAFAFFARRRRPAR